jgi:hypothetical protein
MIEVFGIKAYKIAHKHNTLSFWSWSATKRKAVKFKPQTLVRIKHGDISPYSKIDRNRIFSALENNNIRFAIYRENDDFMTLLLKNEADAALLKLMI